MNNKHVLSEEDTLAPASLTHKLENVDLYESQNCMISVQYNEIDLGLTNYGFNQIFEGDEAFLYFSKMKEFSCKSINEILKDCPHEKHFHHSEIKGKLKDIFYKINPLIVKKSNPLIFHFALNEKCSLFADRDTNTRNPRIYFMVGHSGMIHILFFDPYHEINPINKP